MERNARFWVYRHGSWVKVTLRPGQSLDTCEWGPTDEGYFQSYATWVYEDGIVKFHYYRKERDCDGLFENGGCLVCALDELQAKENYSKDEHAGKVIMVPEWIDEDSWQRDHSAEAMGY